MTDQPRPPAGITLDDAPPLAGSRSGSAVLPGHLGDRPVVVKTTLHDSDEATARADRELAALLEPGLTVPRPPVLFHEVTQGWTTIVLPRLERATLSDAHWRHLLDDLASLHASTPPDRPRWHSEPWPGLDPVADLALLRELWDDDESGAALAWVTDHRHVLADDASAGPVEFTHGDCHLDNVVLDTTDALAGRPLLIDWQSAGWARGTDDLAFLLTRATADPGLAALPGRDLIVRWYASARERHGRGPLAADDLDRAITARQLLVLAFQYPAFAAYLSPAATGRLRDEFVRLTTGATADFRRRRP
ncbi:aminoglycoside phosphotransferase family protein [Aestuariimicrobium soli]|uniref:aminoglycoside phosphotransferase family protein n=1 Tax=Aestuariimicrobium soli TaxID=2035834 RepID=UPI003EBF81DB